MAEQQRDSRLSERETLSEMLVASVIMAIQIAERETAEHVLEALRTLHRDDDLPAGLDRPS